MLFRSTILQGVKQTFPESWTSALIRFRDSPISELRVLLMDVHGSRGINLPEVQHIIFLHAENNLTLEKQTLYRAIRYRPELKADTCLQLHVWHLRIPGSVEERYAEIAEAKQDIKQTW